MVDLPGTYSLNAGSDDEAVACAVVLGHSLQTRAPNLTAVILDATRLRRGLRLVAALQREQVPIVVVLNMMDRVRGQGRELDAERLEQALGVPVVEATGIHAQGTDALRALLDQPEIWQQTGRKNLAQESIHAPALTDDQQAQAWLVQAGM